MDAVTLQSLGAAETVTGSKHFLKTPEANILIDCGLFQGIKSLREKNWQKLSIDAANIDVVILTHAHLDHCGYIPLLVKQGFEGKIYMTMPTRELTELILLDSAKIQEEDADKANINRYSKHRPALPLYTIAEAEVSFARFKTVDYNTSIELSEHISFRFKSSGHILGACSAELACYGRIIIFSGDIGRPVSPILAPPDYFTRADFVVMESTYGDKLHGNIDPLDELAEIINETIDRDGNVLIPSFAVGRAQELLQVLNQLKKGNKIPDQIPVILDSPMAATATDILLRYPEFARLSKDESDEINNNVTINRDYRNTPRIINQKRSKIIIASSGMLSGGRVLDYLKHYIGDTRNTVVFVGYQAEGTRGKAMLSHTHEIKMHGKYYEVKAPVVEITGMSAHADQSELLSWIKKFKAAPEQIMLVHGEPAAQQALRVKIEFELHIPVKIMRTNEEVLLYSC